MKPTDVTKTTIMELLRRFLITITGALASVLILASCEPILDHPDPCPQGARLRFIYDYNREEANAFPSQVKCLTLLVYDSEGKYVTTVTETSDVLSDENWRMDIDLKPGTYRFEAWGGMACADASFSFSEEPAACPEDMLEVYLKPSCITSPVGTNLHHLFYGSLTMTVPEESITLTEGTVKMMKDTNNIRILLCNIDGTPCDGNDFGFAITADNTRLAYNNAVIPTGTTEYLAWYKGSAQAGMLSDGTPYMFGVGELSTCRIMEKAPDKLIITDAKDGREVIEVPLPRILLLMKSLDDRFQKWGDQEFLDRVSDWELTFFLDRGNWLDTEIKIEEWTVRINDITGDDLS